MVPDVDLPRSSSPAVATLVGSLRFLCGFDFIGCLSTAEDQGYAVRKLGILQEDESSVMCLQDFVVSGTTSDQLFGVCESFWRPGRGLQASPGVAKYLEAWKLT